MHLVTGRAGEPHVNSDMVGRFNAGTIGAGSYILPTQNNMACTVVDANNVTIATGDAVVQGRHVTNEAAVTLAIQSGGQEVSRHDLVCVRYTNNGGIESAELAVITGTPSANPVDPQYNDGSILDGDSTVDVPIYRLVINGINLDSVDKLVETITPYEDRQQAIGNILFSGSWAIGATNTVAGLNDYQLFAVLIDNATPVLCYSAPDSNVFRGLGGYVSGNRNVFNYACSFERNGEQMKLLNTGNLNVSGGSTVYQYPVTQIRGII